MVSIIFLQIFVNSRIVLFLYCFPDVSSVTSSRMSVKSGNSGSSRNPGNDSLSHITKEVIELIKMSPKATMKFNKFIPAYHNHFGKQCRVADYGYTKLIELFEALSGTVQVGRLKFDKEKG
jgi:hypothetical protein